MAKTNKIGLYTSTGEKLTKEKLATFDCPQYIIHNGRLYYFDNIKNLLFYKAFLSIRDLTNLPKDTPELSETQLKIINATINPPGTWGARRVLFFFIRTLLAITALAIILPAIPLVIIFAPIIVGTARLIQNIKLWALRAKETLKTPNDLDYEYKPQISVLNQIGRIGRAFLKVALFPFYLWELGINVLVGKLIYPKSFLNPFSSLKKQETTTDDLPNDQFIVKECAIGMPNKVQLYTCEIRHKDTEDSNNMPHIIYFGGNCTTFRNYTNEIKQDAEKLKAKIIGFDHSSFGNSGVLMRNGEKWHVPTSSHNDLVEEGIAQVQRLLNKGVPAEKITLYGHSLGGTIATAVGYHFHNLPQPKRIYLFNDRSLTSPTAFVAGMIAPDKSTKPSLANDLRRIAVRSLLQPLIKTALVLCGWDFNVSNFAEIPEEYREYLLVRGKKNTGEIITDEVIPNSASVHSIPSIKTAYKKWKGEQAEKKPDNPHKFFYNPEQPPSAAPQHVLSLEELTRKDGTTGEALWQDFVKKHRCT